MQGQGPGWRPAARPSASTVEWRISAGPVAYPDALAAMEERVAAIRAGEAPELVWLLEHPPLYTAGTSARIQDLLAPRRFPVFDAGRGGQYTYHGPGQRVAYVMLDLQRRKPDLRRYIWQLEEWVIRTLAQFNVRGERRDGRIGIWVVEPGGREAKIAAIGVRVRRWVTLPRRRDQPRPGPRALQRHRAVRHQRLRRDLVRRARPDHDDGRPGRRAAGDLRGGIWRRCAALLNWRAAGACHAEWH